MTRLIVISSEEDLQEETRLVKELFEAGMELFHLRKPSWNMEQQRNFLSVIPEKFLSMISVHQHYETIDEFGMKYCHVKEKDRKNFSKKNSLQYSTSFHDYTDLQFESHFWNYCFLSPVFDSISKTGYRSRISENLNIEGDLYQRVFALGGVDLTNIEEVFKKEFYGAAVLGAIWKNPSRAVTTFKTLKEKCKPNVHTH